MQLLEQLQKCQKVASNINNITSAGRNRCVTTGGVDGRKCIVSIYDVDREYFYE